jgi:endo-1,4-beta-mannosidase
LQLSNQKYTHIKGFNYVPSNAATIWDVIDRFDAQLWDRELGYAKRFGSNALRVWCDHLSFQRDERQFLDRWREALDLAEAHGLQLMIAMANRWIDRNWQFGQIDYASVLAGAPTEGYQQYLHDFVDEFKDDPRVLMWDLCNEPFSAFIVPRPDSLDEMVMSEDRKQAELEFWRHCATTVREAEPSQPITIGLHPMSQLVPEGIHDVVDVISCHPYTDWWDGGEGFARTCDTYVELANRLGKSLICTETCQGSLDNRTRTEIINVSLRELEQRQIGWMAWHLMAGRIVTGRWDRTDLNCRPGDRSVMYFVEEDGTTREGHGLEDWRDW